MLSTVTTHWAETAPVRNAEDTNSRKLALSIAMPRFYSSPGGGFLRALRSEEYDEPFQPAWMPRRLSAFLITDTGVEFSADGKMFVHSSTGRRELLVLVDTNRNKAYALRGLGNSVEGFDALVKDLNLTVGSSEQAMDLFRIFANIGGGFINQIVTNPRAAQWQVEGFRLRDSGGIDLDQERDSWVKQNANSLQQVSPPHILVVEGGYEVTFFVTDQGAIYRKRLQIQSSGTVSYLDDSRITTAIGKSSATER